MLRRRTLELGHFKQRWLQNDFAGGRYETLVTKTIDPSSIHLFELLQVFWKIRLISK